MPMPPPFTTDRRTATTRVRVHFDASLLDKRVRAESRQSIGQLAAEGVRIVKQMINTPFPPASAPNTPPHRRIGQLLSSIDFEIIDDFTARYGVVFGLIYGLFLEEGTSKMAPRPFLTPTLFLLRRKFAKIFRRGSI